MLYVQNQPLAVILQLFLQANKKEKECRETAGKLTGFDAEKAKTLLAEGMAEEGYTALPEVVLTYSTSDVHKKIAEALQSKFKEVLGVDVKLQNVEASVFAAEQKEFKYQLSRSSFLFDYADPVNALESFITGSSMNRTTWSNPEYDKLITDINIRWMGFSPIFRYSYRHSHF